MGAILLEHLLSTGSPPLGSNDQLLELHEQHSAADAGHGAQGRRHEKGLWTSLTDWTGPNSFGEVNKATRWAPFFSNKKSRIAQELENEIGRVTRLWLDVIESLGIDHASETESPLYCMFGQGKIIRFSIAPGDLQSKGLRTAFQMKKKIAPEDSMLKC